MMPFNNLTSHSDTKRRRFLIDMSVSSGNIVIEVIEERGWSKY
jgi:hypothetical protein